MKSKNISTLLPNGSFSPQSDMNDWMAEQNFRNAYNRGVFASRKVEAYGINITPLPTAISQQESVFWHMGYAAGLDQSKTEAHPLGLGGLAASFTEAGAAEASDSPVGTQDAPD